MLRLAAVLSDDATHIHLLTDFPIRPVQLDNNPNHAFGGVIDYVLAKYSTTCKCERAVFLCAAMCRKLRADNCLLHHRGAA